MSQETTTALQDRVSYILAIAHDSRYRPLQRETSIAARALYEAQLPRILQEEKSLSFFSPQGALLASGFTRVVIGDYGAFVEFAPEHIQMHNIRLRWNTVVDKPVKYIWWEPTDGSNVKLYEQKDIVAYADYKIGYWYVAPAEVFII